MDNKFTGGHMQLTINQTKQILLDKENLKKAQAFATDPCKNLIQKWPNNTFYLNAAIFIALRLAKNDLTPYQKKEFIKLLGDFLAKYAILCSLNNTEDKAQKELRKVLREFASIYGLNSNDKFIISLIKLQDDQQQIIDKYYQNQYATIKPNHKS